MKPYFELPDPDVDPNSRTAKVLTGIGPVGVLLFCALVLWVVA